ncbi:MAG: hypothetical protein SPD81_02070 [Candidatus Faecousia sp.]|nr:hypothetical protein [Candidatus Faecousia sp.]
MIVWQHALPDIPLNSLRQFLRAKLHIFVPKLSSGIPLPEHLRSDRASHPLVKLRNKMVFCFIWLFAQPLGKGFFVLFADLRIATSVKIPAGFIQRFPFAPALALKQDNCGRLLL